MRNQLLIYSSRYPLFAIKICKNFCIQRQFADEHKSVEYLPLYHTSQSSENSLRGKLNHIHPDAKGCLNILFLNSFLKIYSIYNKKKIYRYLSKIEKITLLNKSIFLN